jgi:rRNA maturation RNase YbeY
LIRFVEDVARFKLGNRKTIKDWIKAFIISHNKIVGDICFVFVDDESLLKTNIQYLNHDFYTDVITFDYSASDHVSGDILISVDMVKFNAEKFKVSFQVELYRVMAHGVLHLMGYQDKKKKDKEEMRSKEHEFLDTLELISLRDQS